MPFIAFICFIIIFFYVLKNPSMLGFVLLILLGIILVAVIYYYIMSKRTKKCDICNKEVPYFDNIMSKYTNSVICFTCLEKAGYKPSRKLKITLIDVMNKIIAKEKIKEYNYTHIIEDYIAVNENEKTWSFYPYKKIYKYSDLINYEIIENGKTVYTSVSGKGIEGIGQAVAGGLLFGGVGAIVGATTATTKAEIETNNEIDSIVINIVVNDMDVRTITLNMECSKDIEKLYYIQDTLREIASILDIIKHYNMQNYSNQNNSIHDLQANEIMKFKKLLDDGAITQEEYEKKKKEILGIL